MARPARTAARIHHAAPAIGVLMLLAAVLVTVTGNRNNSPAADAVGAASGGMRIVAVRLADMRISPSVVTVKTGTHVVLDVTNDDTVQHDLLVGIGLRTPLLGHGQTARLDLGRLTRSLSGWCTVPGHKAAGMTMTIEVTGAGAGHATPAVTATTNRPGTSPAVDFAAYPGPDWTPYDPALRPAPEGAEHHLTLRVRDRVVEVAPGVRQTLWTYNGTSPGPTLHGRVGDLFTVTVINEASTGHSIDFHAGSLSPDEPMREIEPGRSSTYRFRARYSGAWMYHCATMPMSLHVANGMYGAVIIDPPDAAKVARQFVLVQSELYLGRQDGTADAAKIASEHPDALVFNGYVNQYDHAPIRVRAGDRVRVWLLDAGPQRATSFHVVGTQFDTVFKEGAYLLRPGNPERGAAQSLDLAPAQGGFVEFTVPAAGHYPFLDHAMVDAERGAHGVFLAR